MSSDDEERGPQETGPLCGVCCGNIEDLEYIKGAWRRLIFVLGCCGAGRSPPPPPSPPPARPLSNCVRPPLLPPAALCNVPGCGSKGVSHYHVECVTPYMHRVRTGWHMRGW